MTDRNSRAPTVYLAGPMVFSPSSGVIFAAMKGICARHGLEGVAPLDNQMGLEGMPPGKDLSVRVARADIDLMNRLDSGLFCLDSFRGPEMDPGTAFEVGWMAALGRPLAGWTRDVREYGSRVRDYFSAVVGQEVCTFGSGAPGARTGAARDPGGMLITSQGCYQNCMIQAGIEIGGGAIFARPGWSDAVDEACAHLAARLRAARGGTSAAA